MLWLVICALTVGPIGRTWSVKFLWMADDESPLSHPAAELGVRTLAAKLGVELPEDAVILLRDEALLGGYTLAQAFAHDGSRAWLVDYRQLVQILATLADSQLRQAGIDPIEPTFERQVRRLVKRRFPHWSEETIEELMGVMPRIANLAFDLDEDGEPAL